MRDMQMSKKNVLVTGGTTGIGLATAQHLRDHGYQVFATGRTIAKETTYLESSQLKFFQMDVSKREDVDRGIQHILEQYGDIDVLVNNAALTLLGPVEQYSLENLQAIFSVNVFGPVFLCQAVLPHMRKKRRGQIVNISSIQGALSTPFIGAYSASKMALEGFSEALALEVLPFGIDVNIIQPGEVSTHSTRTLSANRTIHHPFDYDEMFVKFMALVDEHKASPDPETTQSPEAIAAIIQHVIEHPGEAFRVQTSTFAKDFVRMKLADLSGNAMLNSIKALFIDFGIHFKKQD